MSPFTHRLTKLRAQIKKQGVDVAVITKKENLRFFTGFVQNHPTNREAILLLSPAKALLYHTPFNSAPRYSWLQTIAMSPTHPVEKIYPQFFNSITTNTARENGQKTTNDPIKIALEAANMTVAEKNKLQSSLPHASLIDTHDLADNLRLVKDAAEIKDITKACRITARTMTWATKAVNQLTSQPVTEAEFARLIENKLYQLGADGLAFPVIVAAGKNSALPHHLPGKTKLTSNQVVLLDFGCTVNGYASDITRTMFVSPSPSGTFDVPPRFTEIEKVVRSAYHAALNLLSKHFRLKVLTEVNLKSKILNLKSSSITASQIDAAARSVIDKAGFSSNFIHTTGHGLGLEIHEQPSLNPKNHTVLKPGMVITIEPGIYLKGKFGYRHENTILLK